MKIYRLGFQHFLRSLWTLQTFKNFFQISRKVKIFSSSFTYVSLYWYSFRVTIFSKTIRPFFHLIMILLTISCGSPTSKDIQLGFFVYLMLGKNLTILTFQEIILGLCLLLEKHTFLVIFFFPLKFLLLIGKNLPSHVPDEVGFKLLFHAIKK